MFRFHLDQPARRRVDHSDTPRHPRIHPVRIGRRFVNDIESDDDVREFRAGDCDGCQRMEDPDLRLSSATMM